MKIDLTEIIKTTSKKDLLPVYPILIEDKLIFGVNVDSENSNVFGNECFVVCLNLKTNLPYWILDYKNSLSVGINTHLKISNDILFFCTSFELFAINIKDGSIIWKKVYKNTSPQISIINNRLFFSNWGEMMELDLHTGKKIMSKKIRVNWYDSEIIPYKNRFFSATSNSKIVELSLSTLEVINKYEFPGGWAMGAKPLFFDNYILSSSYCSKIIIFDLDSNLAIKKFNKMSGSTPRQIVIGSKAFFYEARLDNKLTCYDLIKCKKAWNLEINNLQNFQVINNKLYAIFKDKGNYIIGIINQDNGTIDTILDSSEYNYWDRYTSDLWQGVAIEFDKNNIIFAYEPNKLTIITHKNSVITSD